MSALPQMFGGETRVGVRLAEMPPRKGTTMILVHAKRRQSCPRAMARRSRHGARGAAGANAADLQCHRLLAGTDPAAGTLLLTAHLDHLGVGRPVDGDSIYNGANDDAAGTTAVLELAHALAAGPPLRRSVLFVCYGSEELGGLGSTYFGQHPPVPLKDLVANLEFEMIGNQDPKMPEGVLLLTGWDRSNLGPALKEHGALLGPDPYPEQHFFERSDNYSLALEGVVAHTAAGWGTPPTYHQPSDDLAHLDVAFMTRAIQSLIEPVRWLAESDFRAAVESGRTAEGRQLGSDASCFLEERLPSCKQTIGMCRSRIPCCFGVRTIANCADQSRSIPSTPARRRQAANQLTAGFDYARREAMIPMRDGVRLHTVILVPQAARSHAPILLTRTPYSADELTANLHSAHLGRPLRL